MRVVLACATGCYYAASASTSSQLCPRVVATPPPHRAVSYLAPQATVECLLPMLLLIVCSATLCRFPCGPSCLLSQSQGFRPTLVSRPRRSRPAQLRWLMLQGSYKEGSNCTNVRAQESTAATEDQESPGEDRRAQDSPGERKRAQDSPGEPRRRQESLGQPRKAQEKTGGPTEEARRGQESPGQPRRGQESPRQARKAQGSPGEHRKAKEKTGEPRTA